MAFDAHKDAHKLHDAMKGLGTDEDELIKILTHRTPEQIEAIKHAYHKDHAKDLVKEIDSETSGKFLKVLAGLLKDPRHYDAYVIYHAMKGLGTNEKILTYFLVGRTTEEKNKIQEIYFREYNKSLENAVKSETSGDFEKTLVGLLGPRPVEHHGDKAAALADAEKLYAAGEGKLGTDEKTFIEIFTRRSYAHLKEVFAAYETIHKHHTISKAVESEFSGDIKRALLAIIDYTHNPGLFWAKAAHEAMKGLGTDDATLIMIIVGNRHLLGEIKTAYSATYGKTLWEAVKSETSGDYRKSLLAILDN